MASSMWDEAVRRVQRAIPEARVSRSGACVRVDLGGHTAYVLPETVVQLDDLDIVYLVDGMMHGRRP